MDFLHEVSLKTDKNDYALARANLNDEFLNSRLEFLIYAMFFNL